MVILDSEECDGEGAAARSAGKIRGAEADYSQVVDVALEELSHVQ